jgi:hypothetical protein
MKSLKKLFAVAAVATVGLTGIAAAQDAQPAAPAIDQKLCEDTPAPVTFQELAQYLQMLAAMGAPISADGYVVGANEGETLANATAGHSFVTISATDGQKTETVNVMIDNAKGEGCSVSQKTYDQFKPVVAPAPQP